MISVSLFIRQYTSDRPFVLSLFQGLTHHLFTTFNRLHDFMHVNVRDSYCYVVLLRTHSLSIRVCECVCVCAWFASLSLYTILSTVQWSTHPIITVDINLYLVKPILMTIDANNGISKWKAEKSKEISNYVYFAAAGALDKWPKWEGKNEKQLTYQKLICTTGFDEITRDKCGKWSKWCARIVQWNIH